MDGVKVTVCIFWPSMLVTKMKLWPNEPVDYPYVAALYVLFLTMSIPATFVTRLVIAIWMGMHTCLCEILTTVVGRLLRLGVRYWSAGIHLPNAGFASVSAWGLWRLWHGAVGVCQRREGDGWRAACRVCRCAAARPVLQLLCEQVSSDNQL